MADAADSKSVGRKAVWVRLPPPAPWFALSASICFFCNAALFAWRRFDAPGRFRKQPSPAGPLLLPLSGRGNATPRIGNARPCRADFILVTTITLNCAACHIACPRIEVLISY